jgi:hypothetical protein
MTTHRPGPVAADAEPKSSPRSINPVESLRQHSRLALGIALGVIVLGLPAAWWKGRPTFRTEGVLFVSPRFLRNLDTDPEHELQSNSQYREFVQQQVRNINRYDIVANALPPRLARSRYLDPRQGIPAPRHGPPPRRSPGLPRPRYLPDHRRP